MADILARMVGYIGREATSRLGLKESFYAQNQLAGEMLDMMERDPELKQMAEQKYEQHEQEFHSRHPQLLKPPSFAEQMGSIRQAQELDRLHTKSLEAKAALLDARLKGDELSGAQKRGFARDILKYNIVSHMYTAHTAVACSAAAPDPRNKTYRAMVALTEKYPEDAKSVGSKRGGSSAPVSPRAIIRGGLNSRAIPKPGVMQQVTSPKRMGELDESLDRLIGQDSLDKLSTRELCGKLTVQRMQGNEYTGIKLMDKLMEANPQPQERQVGPQPREQNVRRAQEVPTEEVPTVQQTL